MTAEAELWRATVRTRGPGMPDVLERFEEDALSVSVFEIEDEATAEASGWQIDLFYREPPEAEKLADELRLACEAAGVTLDGVTVERVPATDWVGATKLKLPPIEAGRFVVHGSHARDALPAGLVGIEIDAGLAFGSGEHATTHSCLVAIDRLARKRRFHRVLDVGCGSGVLAIAAAKCWPAEVIALDNDPIAVRVAAENVRINGVADRMRVIVAEGYRHPLVRRRAPFDLILANILADPLIELAPALRRHLAPGGHAVLSGLLDRQAGAVIAAHCRQGLHLLERIDRGPWTALVLAAPRAHRKHARR
ncbi:50S ribosomal protein L11 methyltransferase [Benzoatithermus flavus]|uniref:Ribosomal protein L11 methyltransferase n=1 Tax=Benzoatithermus flavus TaxID=3108223 RepID=A0ABU8XXG6_9PROT